VELRVLDLDTLIAIKSRTGRTKDSLVVPILLALRKERGSGGSTPPDPDRRMRN